MPKIAQKTVLWVPTDQNSRNFAEKVRTLKVKVQKKMMMRYDLTKKTMTKTNTKDKDNDKDKYI